MSRWRAPTWAMAINVTIWIILLAVFSPKGWEPPSGGEENPEYFDFVGGWLIFAALVFVAMILLVLNAIWWFYDRNREGPNSLARAWGELQRALPPGWIIDPPLQLGDKWRLRAHGPAASGDPDSSSPPAYEVTAPSQSEAMLELALGLRQLVSAPAEQSAWTRM